MPTATIAGAVTPEQAARALQEQLGSRYEVTPHGSDSLAVKRGAMASATVRLSRAGDATTFRVHGSGLIMTRLVNEFGIARTVTAAIEEKLGSTGTVDVPPGGTSGSR